jgi:hypothetical protein
MNINDPWGGLTFRWEPLVPRRTCVGGDGCEAMIRVVRTGKLPPTEKGPLPMHLHPFTSLRILLGGAALGVGCLVYLVARPPEHTYFLFRIGMTTTLYHALPPLIDRLSENLPAVLHVFAFTLLTGGILKCRKVGSLVMAGSWLITDCAFEVGQKFPTWSEALVPRWCDSLPILENARNYFQTGTFDPLDLVAAAIGATAAYLVLLATTTERRVSS